MLHAPRIAIRVDASYTIGTGHVMRTLTLAQALRQRGATLEFVCREHPGNLIDMIKQQGYLCHSLPLPAVASDAGNGTAHTAWLGAHWQEDAAATKQALSHAHYDWLIVDHYAIERHWEQHLRATGARLFAIDDLADRHHDVDALLDQTLHRTLDAYQPLLPAQTTIFTGSHYALVRPEFGSLRSSTLQRRATQPNPTGRLLIFFGGADQQNLTGTALRALCSVNPFQHIDVVLGGTAPHADDVATLCRTLGATLHIQSSRMAELMSNADLALGAPGSASWERCTLGLPTLLIICADNQRQIAHALASAGAAFVIGETPMEAEYLRNALHTFLPQTAASYYHMTENCRNICDGLGATRITQYLLGEHHAT